VNSVADVEIGVDYATVDGRFVVPVAVGEWVPEGSWYRRTAGQPQVALGIVRVGLYSTPKDMAVALARKQAEGWTTVPKQVRSAHGWEFVTVNPSALIGRLSDTAREQQHQELHARLTRLGLAGVGLRWDSTEHLLWVVRELLTLVEAEGVRGG
jgi:hypothetical protein